ncbi:MAG TPA: hypothetical protein VI932_11450 [Bacteroidota bacterium]|nr:hypothetical protein [Bacteroidota bacterium]
MTTKPPPAVEPSPPDTQEKIAYESVAAVDTVEPNDRHRLGYHVWRWLTTREGTLDDAVRQSGARLTGPADLAVKSIRAYLSSKGITAS